MTAHVDFLIVGDDVASFCAAGCAARNGASVTLVVAPRPVWAKTRGADPAIPNFVWRRLDLQRYDLKIQEVSARVTLFPENKSVATYSETRRTVRMLMENENPDHEVWEDFINEASALARDDFIFGLAQDSSSDPSMLLQTLFSEEATLSRAYSISGSATELLDDYLQDEHLSAHVAAHALSAAGLGAGESGSTATLADFYGGDAWLARDGEDGQSVMRALTAACEDAGVNLLSGVAKPSDEDRAQGLVSVNGDVVKAKKVFFATPGAAARAGADWCAPHGVIRCSDRATATLRLSLKEPIDSPSEDKSAVFQIIDSLADLQDARDDVVKGRLPDRSPVEFEFMMNGDILARTSYVPAAFYEDGESRGWTGQDQQAIEARMMDRLASRLPGIKEAVRGSKLDVDPATAMRAPWDPARVIIQPRRYGTVGGAVELIDKVMGGEK